MKDVLNKYAYETGTERGEIITQGKTDAEIMTQLCESTKRAINKTDAMIADMTAFINFVAPKGKKVTK